MELAKTRGNVGLALLGVFVLGVFGKVAVGARDFDFFRKLVVELVLEDGDFVLELLLNFFRKINHLRRLNTVGMDAEPIQAPGSSCYGGIIEDLHGVPQLLRAASVTQVYAGWTRGEGQARISEGLQCANHKQMRDLGRSA